MQFDVARASYAWLHGRDARPLFKTAPVPTNRFLMTGARSRCILAPICLTGFHGHAQPTPSNDQQHRARPAGTSQRSHERVPATRHVSDHDGALAGERC